jgi:uncharacterized protein (UPF0333 family)
LQRSIAWAIERNEGGEMRLKRMLLVGVVVVAAAFVAIPAGAGTRSATHLSGTYTVDTKAKAKNACKPISKANPAVLSCTVSGFTLVYSGSLRGRGVNTFRWIINCTTGKSYTDGTETFTGSVKGLGSGTFTWGVRSTGTFDCKKGEVTSVSATQNLYSGTGALAGLYGSIHRGPGTYSGVLSS